MIDWRYNNYDNKRISILGGGDGSLMNELLMINRVEVVHVVEIDRRVLETSSVYFEQNNINLDKLRGHRVEIIIQDARKFLLEAVRDQKTWDVIFNDMTQEPLGQGKKKINLEGSNSHDERDIEGLVQQTSPWFFLEPFFNLSMKCLRVGGFFIMKLKNVNDHFDKHTFDKFF